jgi:hypothetical protein
MTHCRMRECYNLLRKQGRSVVRLLETKDVGSLWLEESGKTVNVWRTHMLEHVETSIARRRTSVVDYS